MQRQFTSGSRQAPDPFDQFLEENDFYRKHTARDASCLFRVISEQMYDTQLHHLTIRKKCVRYMRKHRDYFQPLINRDLDEYLDDMSKLKTYGTLIELQAVGYVFQRNVILFEPFDLGKFYSNSPHFNEVFRVFYTPERHFDSVFTCDYIKDAAICQSICYEILYKDLFKLPDVSFAVEQMLHSVSFEGTECRTECNEDGNYTRLHMSDGRSFELDLPQNTCCILENYKLCHFHYTNFPLISNDIQREMKVYTNHRYDSVQDKNALNKTMTGAAESLLPDKFISCVRQLLLEGITPFPYKVAKALDPNMYRNIEFDSWNEARKELKLQNWYNGDANFKLIRYQKTRVHKIFQVGAKCHVKLRKSENDLYTCHIQEIAVDKGYCIVFIEQLGEKRLVPYESLTPLPPDQFKPWTLPYRLQRHMQKYSSFRYTRHYNYRFKCNGQFSAHEYCSSALPSIKSEYYDGDSDDEKQAFSSGGHPSQHHSSCYYKLKQYTHLENFRSQTVEYCAMPLTVEHGNREHEQKVARSAEASTRAASRSSVATVDGQQIKQEHDDATLNGGGVGGSGGNGIMPLMEPHYGMENGVFVPEMHFYPVHQYAGGPEEFYGYGYDGSMHPTALMPANGGGAIYYTCAPSYPPQPPNNLYMHGGPPTQPPLISAALGSNATAGGGAAGGGFFPSTYFGTAMMAQPPPALSTALATSAGMNTPGTGNILTPTTRGAGRGSGVGGGVSSGGSATTSSITPLTGRINWDAKKSVKTNGADLPTDVATLRYFYNLGLDYHNKQQARQQQRLCGGNVGEVEATTEVKEHIVKLTADMQNVKLDENGNIQEVNKGDLHNNNNNNLNSANPKANNQQRRFQSRYFNSKERQAYQQRNGAAMNTSNMQQNRSNNAATSQHQSDLNKNNLNSKAAATTTAGSSNQRNHMHSTNSSANSVNHNGSNNSLHTVTEQNLQTSPLQTYDAGPSTVNGIDTALTPTSVYNPNMNPFITYGAYEYAPDHNGQVPAQFMAPPPAGGVFIQMPLAAPAYGIYSGPPPPPPGALSMHPTTAVYPPYMGHPPPAVAAGTTISPMHGPAPPPPQPSAHNTMTAAVPPTVQAPLQNGFYAAGAPGVDGVVESNGTIADGIGVHYQCMGYPPMPFYYAANTATAMGGEVSSNPFRQTGGQTMNGGTVPAGSTSVPVNQQGYWCVPPTSMPSTQTNPQLPNGGVSNGGTASTHNRREQSTTNE